SALSFLRSAAESRARGGACLFGCYPRRRVPRAMARKARLPIDAIAAAVLLPPAVAARQSERGSAGFGGPTRGGPLAAGGHDAGLEEPGELVVGVSELAEDLEGVLAGGGWRQRAAGAGAVDPDGRGDVAVARPFRVVGAEHLGGGHLRVGHDFGGV